MTLQEQKEAILKTNAFNLVSFDPEKGLNASRKTTKPHTTASKHCAINTACRFRALAKSILALQWLIWLLLRGAQVGQLPALRGFRRPAWKNAPTIATTI